MFPEVNISLSAVIVATVVSMLVGFVWYAPQLFGRQWSKMVGRDMNDNEGAGLGWLLTVVGALATAVILDYMASWANFTTFVQGLVFGLFVGIIVAVAVSVNYIFEARQWKLYAIVIGHHILSLVAMGVIVALL